MNTVCLRRVGILLAIGIARISLAGTGTWSGSVASYYSPNVPLPIPLFVEQSELVSVHVGGQIRLGDCPWSGPEGSAHYGFGREWYGYTPGIVVMKIGDNHFAIDGGDRTLAAPHTGPLSLYVNDHDPQNNEGSFSVTVTIAPGIVGDAGQDGLEDADEDALLAYYAPHSLADSDEDVTPCSAYWFLRNSDAETGGVFPFQREQVPFYPEWFLTQWSQSSDNGCYGCSTNWLDYSFDADTICLQYYQHYPFNDVDICGPDFGEHEGEWELIEVFVHRSDPFDVSAMERVNWHAHGQDPAAAWWDAESGWGWSDEAWPCSPVGPFPPKPQQHVPVYIEAGSHGFYPTQWDCLGAGKNRGDDFDYVPSSVENVGEILRPRPGPEFVLHYNGLWGKWNTAGTTCPPGPPAQRWRHPYSSSADEARYVGPWKHGQQHPKGIAPARRISWPHASISEATAANMSTPGREILVFPGSYPDTLTISTPTTLRAPHGNVTIGQ